MKQSPLWEANRSFWTVWRRTKQSVQVLGLMESFVKMRVFYGEELLAPRPTPKLEDHSLWSGSDCLFSTFAITVHMWEVVLPCVRNKLTMKKSYFKWGKQNLVVRWHVEMIWLNLFFWRSLRSKKRTAYLVTRLSICNLVPATTIVGFWWNSDKIYAV